MMPGTELAEGPCIARPAQTETLLDDTRLAPGIVSSRVIPFALAALTFLTFSPALLNGFVEWDDYINLFENRSYRGLGWAQVRWMFTSTLMGHYIPVTWLTYGLDYTLWGMNPLGYHLTNLLIHATNAALFYLVALRVLRKATTLDGSVLRLAGVMATLFFALHPLRTESVAWATERRDVLSGLFFLLTVLIYLAAADAEGGRRRRLLAGSVACYVLALLSKSIVMTLPFVLIVLDVYPLGRLPWRWGAWRESSVRAVVKEKLPYLALGLAGAATSFYAVASNDFLTPVERYGWPARIAMTGYSLWFYFAKTVVPIQLSVLYELPARVDPLKPQFLFPVVAVLIMVGVLLSLSRRWPAGLAVWIYYAIILAPVSGIVHAGHQLAHDRYSYLSCLGWALLVGAAVGSFSRARASGPIRPSMTRVAAAVVAAWILALAAQTWYQVQTWRDTDTLWRYALESDSQCALCHANLGLSFYRRKLFPLAKEKYELALRLRPDRVRWNASLGLVAQGMGDFDEAIRYFGLARIYYPNDPDIIVNMAIALMEKKRYAEAITELNHAHRINPKHVPTLVTLGAALRETGQAEEALAPLLRARDLSNDEPVIYLNLTRTYLTLGKADAARQEYERLQRLDGHLAQSLTSELLLSR